MVKLAIAIARYIEHILYEEKELGAADNGALELEGIIKAPFAATDPDASEFHTSDPWQTGKFMKSLERCFPSLSDHYAMRQTSNLADRRAQLFWDPNYASSQQLVEKSSVVLALFQRGSRQVQQKISA